MPFSFQMTDIPGLMVIVPHLFQDERGTYQKCYERAVYEAHGISCTFRETSNIRSQKGVLRGLHYQTVDSQAKLVHAVSGICFDVALDLRADSPTFGQYHTELLCAEDNKVIFIPEGFAHGFLSLTEYTIFSYQCSGTYLPESCGGILWNDPGLAIPWPLQEYGIHQVITTEKDQNWPTLKRYKEIQKIYKGIK